MGNEVLSNLSNYILAESFLFCTARDQYDTYKSDIRLAKNMGSDISSAIQSDRN